MKAETDDEGTRRESIAKFKGRCRREREGEGNRGGRKGRAGRKTWEAQ